MMKYASLTLALAVGFSISAAPVSAQLLDAAGSGVLDVSVQGTGISTDASTTVQIRNDAAATSSDTDEAAALDAGVAAGLGFSIVRKDMDENTEYGITESHQVRSSAGLESYAAASARADERLEAVAIADNRMEITYRKPARFLGFIPGSVHTDIAVDADGQVSADYAWYAFLFAKGESEAELAARLAADIETVSASVATDAEGDRENLEIRRWANILDGVHAGLSAEAGASAS